MVMSSEFPKRDLWRRLPKDTPRGRYFEALREAVTEFYLADPSNPYQQAGRSSGAERWQETRGCFMEALHHDGDFMDIGCANGLLLETLISWAAEIGIRVRPHGLDFVPELIELARNRFPNDRDSFSVGNAFDWAPTRRYDFVRTNLEYVPSADWSEFVRRQSLAVAPGGRLIVCQYRNQDEPSIDPGIIVQQAGFAVAGRTQAPGVAVVWIDR